MSALSRRVIVALIVTASVGALAMVAAAQFQGRRGGGRFAAIPPNPDYDGAFMFCRIMFRNASDGDGAGWSVDWPRADENLSLRFSELTRTSVSRASNGGCNHALMRLTDADPAARHHDDRTGRRLLR